MQERKHCYSYFDVQSVSTVDTGQVWYYDDASAGSHLTQLCSWDKVEQKGPAFGYFVNIRDLYFSIYVNGLREWLKFDIRNYHVIPCCPLNFHVFNGWDAVFP